MKLNIFELEGKSKVTRDSLFKLEINLLVFLSNLNENTEKQEKYKMKNITSNKLTLI